MSRSAANRHELLARAADALHDAAWVISGEAKQEYPLPHPRDLVLPQTRAVEVEIREALRSVCAMNGSKEPAALLLQLVRWAIPRTLWTVVERNDHAEFVIWRQWLGRAYDINSVAALPGRYDRETRFGLRDEFRSDYRKAPLDG